LKKLLFLIFLFLASSVYAETYQLHCKWDLPSDISCVDGYELYWKSGTEEYSTERMLRVEGRNNQRGIIPLEKGTAYSVICKSYIDVVDTGTIYFTDNNLSADTIMGNFVGTGALTAEITVTGSANNNGTFTSASTVGSAITLATDEALTTETTTATLTYTLRSIASNMVTFTYLEGWDAIKTLKLTWEKRNKKMQYSKSGTTLKRR
jgi:hypothetical protein